MFAGLDSFKRFFVNHALEINAIWLYSDVSGASDHFMGLTLKVLRKKVESRILMLSRSLYKSF